MFLCRNDTPGSFWWILLERLPEKRFASLHQPHSRPPRLFGRCPAEGSIAPQLHPSPFAEPRRRMDICMFFVQSHSPFERLPLINILLHSNHRVNPPPQLLKLRPAFCSVPPMSCPWKTSFVMPNQSGINIMHPGKTTKCPPSLSDALARPQQEQRCTTKRPRLDLNSIVCVHGSLCQDWPLLTN